MMPYVIEMLERIAELERQMQNVVRFGTIESIDYAIAMAKVRLEDNLLTPDIPWTSRRAHGDIEWWAPEVGEQVVVFAPQGELGQAIIDSCLYQDDFPAPENLETVHSITYADGAKISYDRENSVLSAILPAGATINVESDGGINLKGDLIVTGSITASVDLSDASGSLKRLRDNYNTGTYPVISLGSPTGTSLKPDV